MIKHPDLLHEFLVDFTAEQQGPDVPDVEQKFRHGESYLLNWSAYFSYFLIEILSDDVKGRYVLNLFIRWPQEVKLGYHLRHDEDVAHR